MEKLYGVYFVNGYINAGGRCRAVYSPAPYDNEDDAMQAAEAWANHHSVEDIRTLRFAPRGHR